MNWTHFVIRFINNARIASVNYNSQSRVLTPRGGFGVSERDMNIAMCNRNMRRGGKGERGFAYLVEFDMRFGGLEGWDGMR